MTAKTPLYQQHVDAGARIVDFGGWDMPLHYGSQLDEHHAVRQNVGIFDVSHMTVVDLSGNGTTPFLQQLLANDVGRLTSTGKALYSCMLNANGGVIDDLIVYNTGGGTYRVVVNAATRDKDIAWITEQSAAFDVAIVERTDLAMIAVQGPNARQTAAALLGDEWRDSALALQPFFAMQAGDLFVARTGYTGEDGWEISLPADQASAFWQGLIANGAAPCGLGARDTLRLEAGMSLYGNDLDEQTSPLECGLGWTIAWEPTERQFVGRAALEAMRANADRRRLVGLLLESKGVLRDHQRVVIDGLPDGEITSGGFSPTMQRSIAMARVPAGSFEKAQVEVRNRLLDVSVVKLPFVRNGEIRIDI